MFLIISRNTLINTPRDVLMNLLSTSKSRQIDYQNSPPCYQRPEVYTSICIRTSHQSCQRMRATTLFCSHVLPKLLVSMASIKAIYHVAGMGDSATLVLAPRFVSGAVLGSRHLFPLLSCLS